MPRRFGPAAVALASLAGTGCLADGDWSVRRALGWDEVRVPRNLKLPAAHVATSERVETLGRRIVAQNTFTGIEPMFYTAGVPEAVLFHRGAEELIISEGLVGKCKTEAELAAVLCSELGHMIAEKHAARRAGADRDTFPESSLPGGTSVGGGVADDPGRAAEAAFRERRREKNPPVADHGEAAKIARDLLAGAGFEAAEFDRVQSLVKQSDRGAALRKQMSGSAPAPKWER